jgi:hypothetical protein
MVDRLFLKMPVRLLGDREQSPNALNIRRQSRITANAFHLGSTPESPGRLDGPILPIGVGRFPARSATALQAGEKRGTVSPFQ